jgi:hypothetical protein
VTAEERAARLLRWYPRAWRDRYGEEFAELLIADIEERPQAAGRSLDVVRSGVVARLSGAGLCGLPLRGPESMTGGEATSALPAAAARHVTASLGSAVIALAVALGFGAAMWSQLTIGWQWSAPGRVGSAAAVATVATSVAMSALLLIAALAVVPVLWSVGRRVARRQAGGLIAPLAVLIAAAAILVVGGRYFENGWPGTGGHDGLVPGGVAAFEWATSLSVSSYWAHPGMLSGFPAGEVAWMAVCPLVQIAVVGGAVALVRLAGLSRRQLAFETRLAAVACAVVLALVAGCAGWVATGGRQAAGQFHAGEIDLVGIAALALALAVAAQAARTARRGLAAGQKVAME